jgi:hypothetical protein
MEQITQYGAVAIIFAFAIKEFFAYLRTRKENGGNNDQEKRDREQDKNIASNSTNIAVMLQMLTTIKENHLVHLQENLDRIEKENKEWHTKINEKLEKLLNR